MSRTTASWLARAADEAPSIRAVCRVRHEVIGAAVDRAGGNQLDAGGLERVPVLLDQLSAMHENEAALAKPLRGRDDVGERYGFT